MKLWQKISLIALVFVTLAVQLTQFYILDSHFRSAIAREVNSAASAHSALAASLSNHAAYERLKANTLFLSTDQLTDMLKDTITTDISTADVIEVKKGGKTISFRQAERCHYGRQNGDLRRRRKDVPHGGLHHQAGSHVV